MSARNLGISPTNTIKGNKEDGSKNRRLSQSPKVLNSADPIFISNKTNAEIHRNKQLQKNNFLRVSINAGAKAQMDSRGSRASGSSKGFNDIRKALKRGSNKGTTHRDKPITRNDLVLDTRALKEQYAKTPRKLPKRRFSKSPAVFKLDAESPYAEYLPDLYREYKPKEKKLKRQKSDLSLNNFFKKIDKAYSEVQSIGPKSRASSRNGGFGLSRKGTNTRSLRKMNTFRSESSVSSSGGNNTVRSNPARLNKKRKKNAPSDDDSFMKIASMIKQKVMQNKNN